MKTCHRCGTEITRNVLVELFGTPTTTCEPCSTFIKSTLPAWEQRLNFYLADRFLSPEEEADLRNYQLQLGLTDQDLAPAMPRLLRAKQLSAINMGDLPQVHPGNALLSRGEVCHYASASALYQEIHTSRYVSNTTSRGVRGSFYNTRSRSHVGRWVQTATTQCTAQGMLAITNMAVRFASQFPVVIALENLLGFEWYQNALVLQFEDKPARDFFTVHDGELAGAILWVARQRLLGDNEG
jgi:hypothetical protein